jgi:hypothetical protein
VLSRRQALSATSQSWDSWLQTWQPREDLSHWTAELIHQAIGVDSVTPHRLSESGRITRATPGRPALHDESTWRCSRARFSRPNPTWAHQHRHRDALPLPRQPPRGVRQTPPPPHHTQECSSFGVPPSPRGPSPPARLLRAAAPAALPAPPRSARTAARAARRGGLARSAAGVGGGPPGGGGAGVQPSSGDACEGQQRGCDSARVHRAWAAWPGLSRIGPNPSAEPGRPRPAVIRPSRSRAQPARPSHSAAAAVVPPLPRRRPRRRGDIRGGCGGAATGQWAPLQRWTRLEASSLLTWDPAGSRRRTRGHSARSPGEPPSRTDTRLR